MAKACEPRLLFSGYWYLSRKCYDDIPKHGNCPKKSNAIAIEILPQKSNAIVIMHYFCEKSNAIVEIIIIKFFLTNFKIFQILIC